MSSGGVLRCRVYELVGATLSSAGYRATAVTASGESIVVVSSTVNPLPPTGVPVITCRLPEIAKIC